jgi:hypothetical protein
VHKVFGDVGTLLRHYLAVFVFSADIAYLGADDPAEAFLCGIENTQIFAWCVFGLLAYPKSQLMLLSANGANRSKPIALRQVFWTS